MSLIAANIEMLLRVGRKFTESNRYILKIIPLQFHRRHFQKPPRHDPPTMLSELRQFQGVGMLQLLQKQLQSNRAYFLFKYKNQIL